jgi:hypothetical protein
MPTMARLIVEDAYLPLEADARAMLISSLKDIIKDLGRYGRLGLAPAVVYIEAPKTRIAHPKETPKGLSGHIPIMGGDCSQGPKGVGCHGL